MHAPSMLAELIERPMPSERIVFFVVPSLAHKSIHVSAPSYRSFLWRAIGMTPPYYHRQRPIPIRC